MRRLHNKKRGTSTWGLESRGLLSVRLDRVGPEPMSRRRWSLLALFAGCFLLVSPRAHGQTGPASPKKPPMMTPSPRHQTMHPAAPYKPSLLRQTFDVSPSVGTTGQKVILTGTFPFVTPTAVRFGALPAAYFSRNADGTITAGAPYDGVAGSAVRITVLDKGHLSQSVGFYSYRIAYMEATGPLPMDTSEVGDARWYNGRGHAFGGLSPPAVLAFSEPPTFHVRIAFVDDSAVNPPHYDPPFSIGNFATYSAHLQTCDISRRPESDASGCANWDGNVGTWTSAGDVITARLDSRRPGVSEMGDLALPTSLLFDEAHLVRTLRIQFHLEENDTHHSTIDRVDSKDSAPFTAVLTPTALIQVKAMPFTIIYQPPGDASTASYQTNASYSTAYKLGTSSDQSATNTAEQAKSSRASIKLTAPLFGSSASAGGNWGESWDETTKAGFGTSDSSTDTATATLAFQTQWSLPADPDVIPGAGDTCVSATDCSTLVHASSSTPIEPFWADTFVFLVHPQFALWVLNAGSARYVMTGAVPVTADATVAQLAACWGGNSRWPGAKPCELPYSHSVLRSSGGSIVYSGAQDHITLDPEEAHRFLLLDPFFSRGQNAEIRADRGLLVSSVAYGTQFGDRPKPVSVQLTRTAAHSSDRAGVVTTTLTVTNVRGADSSFDVAESLFGVFGMSGSSGESSKLTSTYDLRTTFTDSTAVTTTNATQGQVTLNDLDVTSANCSLPHCHLPLRGRPSVNIYLDRAFGGFMFQDPGSAPHNETLAITAVLRDRIEAAVGAVVRGDFHAAQSIVAERAIAAPSRPVFPR
jgi:hypothetical protein